MKFSSMLAMAFVALFMAGAAKAGPREEVLAGAIRCGSVGQDRQWLDCYYGSAQPMRAQLHLSPAPPVQQSLAAGGQGGGMGGARQDVLSGAIRCSGIADDRQWLDCYYGSAQPMRAHLGLSPAPQAQQAMLPAAPPPPMAPAPYQQASALPPAPYARPAGPPRMPSSPGFFDGLFGDDPVVAKTQLASYTMGGDGFFTATLANGQVWEQVSGPTANWRKNPSSYRVTVSRGMMRTFNLRVAGDPNLYKVRPAK